MKAPDRPRVVTKPGQRPSLPRASAASPWPHALDLAGAVVLAVVALIAALQLDPRSTVRLALVAPLVLVVPGYVLIQAVMGASSRLHRRPIHAVFSLGVTPALLGLLGLGTTLLPSGFQALNILVVVTVFCCGCAALAGWRRAQGSKQAHEHGTPSDTGTSGSST